MTPLDIVIVVCAALMVLGAAAIAWNWLARRRARRAEDRDNHYEWAQ